MRSLTMERSDDRQLDLLPGTLSMLILKTLARVGPSHGYGIAQFTTHFTERIRSSGRPPAMSCGSTR